MLVERDVQGKNYHVKLFNRDDDIVLLKIMYPCDSKAHDSLPLFEHIRINMIIMRRFNIDNFFYDPFWQNTLTGFSQIFHGLRELKSIQ